ncbi:unnamed protein product [Cunninghamella blakesleeana]
MVNAKKNKKQVATENSSKKVTFSQEKKVKTFDKNKALIGKRSATEADIDIQQPKKALKSSLKTKVTKSVKAKVELESSDEDNDDIEEVEEEKVIDDDNENNSSDNQEESLRKEIMGDLVEFGDSDSSDDEEETEDNIGKSAELIKLAKNMKKAHEIAKKRLEVVPQKEKDEEKGWVYVGRIPKSLVEDDLRKYFEQFGDIERLRISKNRKGSSRHYGFIEFSSSEVAEIVAETMNNYSIGGHMLQCAVIPSERRHGDTFNGSENKNYHAIKFKKDRDLRTKDKSLQEYIDSAKKLMSSEKKKINALKKKNINYEFNGFEKSFNHWKPIFDLQLKNYELETESKGKKKVKKAKRVILEQ